MLIHLIFALFLYLCFIGWGLLFKDIFLREDMGRPPSLCGVIGISVVIVIGGLLNIFQLIGTSSFIAIYSIGILYTVIKMWQGMRGKLLEISYPDGRTIFLIISIIVISLPITIPGLYCISFNPADDLQGYFIPPTRMIQLGTFYPDPFNFRSNYSVSGSASFLQAGVIKFLGYSAISMIDKVVGVFMLIEALCLFLNRTPVGFFPAIVLLIFFFIQSTFILNANITSVYLAFAMLLALYCLLERNKSKSCAVPPILIGFILGAVSSLKNSFIPFAYSLFFLFWAVHIIKTGKIERIAVKKIAIAFFISVGIVSVWYFPRLLSGSYVNIEQQTWKTIIGYTFFYFKNTRYLTFVLGLQLFLFSFCLFLKLKRKEPLFHLLILYVASLSACVIFIFATQGYSTYLRHMYQYILFSSFIFAAELFRSLDSVAWKQLFLVMVVFVGFGIDLKLQGDGQYFFRSYITKFVSSVSNLSFRRIAPFPSSREIEELRGLQEKARKGTGILVWTEKPYMLDFSRNKLYVVDIPCSTGPSPDIPCDGDGRRLSEYLLYNGITHIMFSRQDKAYAMRSLDNKLNPVWVKQLFRNQLTFGESLESIMKASTKVVSEGNIFLAEISLLSTNQIMPAHY